MKNIRNFLIAPALLALCACGGKETTSLTASGIDPKCFEKEIDGKHTALYVLKNSNGMEACITNYGGRLVSLMVPDKDGNMRDVVLGFDSIAQYDIDGGGYETDFGASIGRYANRIDHGRLVIGEDTIILPTNNVKDADGNFIHTLHGGPRGWQYKVYDVKNVTDSTITLVMDSPDGDNSFPGNVIAEVKYLLTDDNSLDITFTATTDKPTVVNMTNHAYFNLTGNPENAITGHELMINADNFTPIDATFMTTGEIAPVEGTPFDFTCAKVIGTDITADDEQLANGNGYDHNWVLNTEGSLDIPAVVLYSPESGIQLTTYTNEPGIQVYTGNFLDGTVTGKKGIVYNQRAGVCLETQHYPDSPNKPEWPSTQLNPGETYYSRCIYKFENR